MLQDRGACAGSLRRGPQERGHLLLPEDSGGPIHTIHAIYYKHIIHYVTYTYMHMLYLLYI